jgi:hypothetical protein
VKTADALWYDLKRMTKRKKPRGAETLEIYPGDLIVDHRRYYSDESFGFWLVVASDGHVAAALDVFCFSSTESGFNFTDMLSWSYDDLDLYLFLRPEESTR